jgi:hypothetical protein
VSIYLKLIHYPRAYGLYICLVGWGNRRRWIWVRWAHGSTWIPFRWSLRGKIWTHQDCKVFSHKFIILNQYQGFNLLLFHHQRSGRNLQKLPKLFNYIGRKGNTDDEDGAYQPFGVSIFLSSLMSYLSFCWHIYLLLFTSLLRASTSVRSFARLN